MRLRLVSILQLYTHASADYISCAHYFTVKSPAFTHLAATLNGLTTIRVNKTEEILTREFDNHQDTHTACRFMAVSTTSTFGFCLDVITLTFLACIIFYFMLFDTSASGVKIGLAVSQAISLTGMAPWGECSHYWNVQYCKLERESNFLLGKRCTTECGSEQSDDVC